MKPVEDPNGKIEVDGKRYKMKRIAVNDGRVFYSPRSYFGRLCKMNCLALQH